MKEVRLYPRPLRLNDRTSPNKHLYIPKGSKIKQCDYCGRPAQWALAHVDAPQVSYYCNIHLKEKAGKLSR